MDAVDGMDTVDPVDGLDTVDAPAERARARGVRRLRVQGGGVCGWRRSRYCGGKGCAGSRSGVVSVSGAWRIRGRLSEGLRCETRSLGLGLRSVWVSGNKKAPGVARGFEERDGTVSIAQALRRR